MPINLAALQQYSTWLNHSAEQIYHAVLGVSGWKNVFPHTLPPWASKVRNYFNLAPATLVRLADADEKRMLKQAQQFVFKLDCHMDQTVNRYKQDRRPNPFNKPNPAPWKVHANCPAKADHDVIHTNMTDDIAIRRAFAGAVYKDESGRLWYQMAAGSTIYHYGDQPWNDTIEGVYVEKILGQNDVPVFKLISPDNTGGSNEIILKNSGNVVVISSKQTAKIRDLLVVDAAYQGSYNYSETSQVGLAAHRLRDVSPHVPGKAFYVNPLNPFSPLRSRRFPVNDLQGRPLANQVR
jgi:hypothetical protein